MSNDVEDECHFVLNCPVYESERKKMFDSIRETTGYDMSCMENDWKMDALIGDGLCSFRSEIREHVMKYIVAASKGRERWLGRGK